MHGRGVRWTAWTCIEMYEVDQGAPWTRPRESLPTFIEARCYRYRGHSMSDPVHGHYRTKDEVERWQKAKDPIRRLRGPEGSPRAHRPGELRGDQRRVVRTRSFAEAIEFADDSPEPWTECTSLSRLSEVYADPYGLTPGADGANGGDYLP
jgi:TPP-dependent pyruvate/acetoin dehydrogenase alpha subunit